jgi:hypothetical protein
MSTINQNFLFGIAAASLFSLYSQTANAQADYAPYRTKIMLPACETAVLSHNENSSILRFHEGLCMGVLSTTLRAGAAMNNQFRFCAPANLNLRTFMPILSNFVAQNPAALDLDLRDVVNYVARINYPCR